MAEDQRSGITTENDSIASAIKLFGMPSQMTDRADPRVSGYNVGRKFYETILSSAPIVAICPCAARFMPGMDQESAQNFVNSVSSAMNDGGSYSGQAEGKYYTITPKVGEYYQYVNLMCRMAAINLGIGKETVPGTSTQYENYDWINWSENTAGGFYNAEKKSFDSMMDPDASDIQDSAAKSSLENIMSFVNNLNPGSKLTSAMASAASDLGDAIFGAGDYVKFYCDGQGSSIAENISVTTRSSFLESTVDQALSDVAKEISYFTGGSMLGLGGVEADMSNLVDEIFGGTQNNFISSLMSNGSRYLQGHRLVFPKMIDEVSYDKSISLSFKFLSPSGDLESCFLHTMVPLFHLLAFVFPKQTSANMYTYPFLVKSYSKGWYSCNAGVVTSLDVKRGGSDDTRWSEYVIPTEIDVDIQITPLVNQMMMTSSKHPILYMQNEGLIEYLAAICGVDLTVSQVSLKANAIAALIENRVTDIPQNIYKSILDNNTLNWIGSIFRMT